MQSMEIFHKIVNLFTDKTYLKKVVFFKVYKCGFSILNFSKNMWLFQKCLFGIFPFQMHVSIFIDK